MNPETKTAPPATGSNGGGGSDTTTTRASEMSESSSSIGGWGRSRGGCTRRGGHQGCGGRGWSFNLPAYTSSFRDFKGEVEYYGAVLGITSEQREAKDKYKKLSKKLNQYILRELHNPEYIIVMFRYLKYPTTFLNT